VAAVVLALVAAGCGSSSDDDSPADSATRAAHIDDLNKVCAAWAHDVTKTSQHFEAVQVQASANQRFEVTAERYDELAGGLDRLVARAKALASPDADADTIDAWLASTGDRAAAERDLATALRARPADPAAVGAAQDRLRAASADANAAISAYGAHDCAPRTELDPDAAGGG
jgi:hypothetical protein